MSLALYKAPKIAFLHSLCSWAIYFAFAWRRLAKIIFFRGLIKYLTHNYPHITTKSGQQNSGNPLFSGHFSPDKFSIFELVENSAIVDNYGLTKPSTIARFD